MLGSQARRHQQSLSLFTRAGRSEAIHASPEPAGDARTWLPPPPGRLDPAVLPRRVLI
uniref:Uncharacterized protein n=1 Tax=Rothia terrae TaxID=396015 RepID=A0A7H2BDV8_9MICC